MERVGSGGYAGEKRHATSASSAVASTVQWMHVAGVRALVTRRPAYRVAGLTLRTPGRFGGGDTPIAKVPATPLSKLREPRQPIVGP